MALHACPDSYFERGGKTPRIIDVDTWCRPVVVLTLLSLQLMVQNPFTISI